MASIQTVYVALFGRPADPAGLAFFNAATSNGANLTAIGDLAATSEYQTRFAGKSNTQIVTDIYMSLFGHAPDAAGLAFFVDALNKGTQNINSIAINIADGAQGTDKTLLEKKVAAADLFTAALDTPVEVGNYTGTAAAAQGAAFITAVTATSPAPTAASADAAVAGLGSPGGTTGTVGVSIALTAPTSADTVSLTSANTAFKSTANDDKISGTAIASGANIDAGGGADMLTLTGQNTAPGATNPTIAGVEKFFIVSSAAANGLNFSKTTGETEVWVSTTGTPAAGNGGTHTNISKGATVGIEGNQGANAVSFSFLAADVAGGADAATLATKGATAGGVTIDAGIEMLTISNSGGNSALGGLTTSAQSVTITGSGNVNTGAIADAGLSKLDASGLSGGLTATTAATAGTTVTGGKGIDAITLGDAGAASTLDKDVVVYTKANVSTVSTIDVVNNFQAGEDKLDLKALGLTGTQAATTFTAAPAVPAEGTSFLSNAIAIQATGATTFNVYADTNNDGVYNQATDLAVTVNTLGATAFTASDVIFA